MTKKEQFIDEFNKLVWKPMRGRATYLVVVVELPHGAKELIVNSNNIHSKFEYYCDAYYDDMSLKANPDVKIVDWMFA